MNNNFKVDFVGIGAQKAATSWIAKCLIEHPEICLATSKETHFFSDNERFNQGLNFYRKYFPPCKKASIMGEYSTTYLASSQAPARIKRYFPKVKLIACLRNPMDRAFSHYLHLKSSKRFKDALGENVSFREAVKKHPAIIENGMYGKSLERYLNLFSKDQMLLLFHDDIKKDSRGFIKKIYRFLRIKENFVPKGVDRKYQTSSVRFSPLFKKVNKYYHLLKKNAPGRLILRTAKFLGIDSYFINDLINFINKFKKSGASLSQSDRKYLLAIYQEDIRKLEGLTGKNLKSWQQNN